jgi:hypothetical protein
MAIIVFRLFTLYVPMVVFVIPWPELHASSTPSVLVMHVNSESLAAVIGPQAFVNWFAFM